MGAVYPTSIASFTEKENKIDIADASHVNKLQEEVVAIETELGLNPAGSLANLVDRLALVQDTDGSLAKGTEFPTNPVDGQGFYRSDLDVYNIYNGSTWDAQGQSLSNVIFQWSGVDNEESDRGLIISPALTNSTFQNMFLGTLNTTTWHTLLNFKWNKIAGVSSIRLYARLWADVTTGGSEAYLRANIGASFGTARSLSSTTPTWYTGDLIDVSGLDVGTSYLGTIQLRNGNASNDGFCSAVTLIGV